MYLFFQQNYNFVHEVANFRQLKQVGVFFFFFWQISALWRRQNKREKIQCATTDKCGSKDFLWNKCAKVTRFWGKRILKSPYLIETMWGVLGSSRSPKYRRILNDFFDSVIQIWLIPLVDDCCQVWLSITKLKKGKKKPGTEFISRSPKFDQP